jgi:aryl sulfotransferase
VSARTIWLASYPKSGNTWLRAVLTASRTGGPVDINDLDGGPIAANRLVVDDALGVPSSSLTPDEVELVRPRIDDVLAAEAPGPLLRKIHDGLFRGPGGEPIVSAAATRAALYMVRDPRAIAVSYAHHSGQTLDWASRRLSDPDAAMSPTSERLGPQVRQRLGTWSEHVRSWTDDAPFPVHVLRYEDCATAPVPTFADALRFAGVGPVDDESVARAVEHASFARLREAEAEHGFDERPVEVSSFFRRGEAGSWRDELPRELAAAIADDHGQTMARFGYPPE